MLLEAEHHGSKVDVLAYYRRQSAQFGLGQNNRSEIGTEKVGLDARYRLTEQVTISALGYQEDYLQTGARRRAGNTELEYRSNNTSLRAGLTYADDKLADGSTNRSTLVKLGGSQQFFDGKLELDAQSEFAIGGEDESIDFPARHKVGARYAVRSDIAPDRQLRNRQG